MYVGDEEGWRHPATIRVAEGGLQFPLPTSSFIWKNKSSSCSRGGGVSSQGRTFFMANDFSPPGVSLPIEASTPSSPRLLLMGSHSTPGYFSFQAEPSQDGSGETEIS